MGLQYSPHATLQASAASHAESSAIPPFSVDLRCARSVVRRIPNRFAAVIKRYILLTALRSNSNYSVGFLLPHILSHTIGIARDVILLPTVYLQLLILNLIAYIRHQHSLGT
jgi:hypothetical protein